MKNLKKGLYCDDYRVPDDVHWINFDYSHIHWTIVRNYQDFVRAIEEEDFDVISFDHDLDRTSTYECINCNTQERDFDYSRVKEKTGKDCATFLLDFCIINRRDLPWYVVHSLNHKGAQNIIDILGTEKLLANNTNLLLGKADELIFKDLKK